MGKSTNDAVAARARTRDRRVAADVDTAARRARIGVATAEVQRAKTAIDAAREQAALAIAAARALERAEVVAAETIIAEAVRRLSGERLTVAQVADLVGMPAPEVRRILRSTSSTDENLWAGQRRQGGNRRPFSGRAAARVGCQLSGWGCAASRARPSAM